MMQTMRFVLLCVSFLVGSVHAADALRVALSQSSNAADQQTGMVILTLTNQGTTAIDVLKWRSPFIEAGGGLPNDLFTITDSSGKRVAYLGSFAKFVNMTAESFIHLAPGQSISKTVDLGKDYNLSNGPYTVVYDQDLSVAPPKADDARAIPAPIRPGAHSTSNALHIWVNGSLQRQKNR